ncbi:MAG: exodeoxyribonuclease V subunit gamma [Planctomycetota bacterium]
MLRVCLSNDLGELAAAMAELLPPDPLERVLVGATVVVPDRVHGTFVEDVLARRDGVCAGVDFLSGEAFAARVCAGAARLVEHGVLRGLLVDLLAAPGSEPELAPVRAYVAGDPRRLAQLAGLLARRFLVYDRERPALLRAWRAGEETGEGVAAWQRALYLRVFGPGGALSRLAASEPEAAPRRALSDLLEDEQALAALEAPAWVVALIGPTLSPTQARLYERLAERSEVHLFAHTPAVPWGELAPAELRGAVACEDAAWFGPLAAWREPERARLAALVALAGRAGVSGRFVAPRGEGLLGALQRAVLSGGAGAAQDDGSLRAASFASRRAEVEHALEQVLALLEREAAPRPSPGRPAQLHEVALLAPAGLDAYRPLIDSVFADAGVPVRFLVGAPDDRLHEACRALLDLIGHPCPGRAELSAVLLHPAVLRRADLARADVLRWLDELAIHLGLDRAQQAGTYLDGPGPDLFHAERALQRLTLGAFCEGERRDEERLVSLAGDPVPPFDVGQEQRAAVARFALLVRSLRADAEAARQPRPLAAWGAWLAALITGTLAGEDDDEESLLISLERRLRRLGPTGEAAGEGTGEGAGEGAEEGPADQGPGAGPAVELATAVGCAQEALSELGRAGSRHLAGGVLVAESLPPLPLRQLHVLGLADGFPARETRDGLDLRGDPADDEPTPGRAARAALLASLSAAAEVHLSYVDLDGNGEEVFPSPILDDLRRAARQLLDPDAGARWLRAHPAPARLPRLEREAGPAELREHLLKHLGLDGPDAPLPPLERLRGEVAPATRAVVDQVLGRTDCDVIAPGVGAAEVIDVSVAQLRRFLASPLQETARQVGLSERLEPEQQETEPQGITPLDQAVLLREVFVNAWNRALEEEGELEATLDLEHARMLEREERRGRRVPTRVFLRLLRGSQREVLAAWAMNLGAHLGSRGAQPLRTIRLGGVTGVAGGDEVEDALELPIQLPGELPGGRRVTARISGRLQLLVADRAASVVLRSSTSWKETAFVEGALTHVLLAATGLRADQAFRVLQLRSVGAAKPYPQARELLPLGRDEARAYLSELVADLLVGQWEPLPLEAVLDWEARRRMPLREEVLRARDGRFASCRYGPLSRLEGFAPPDEERAQALAMRRLGLYFRLRVPWAKKGQS